MRRITWSNMIVMYRVLKEVLRDGSQRACCALFLAQNAQKLKNLLKRFGNIRIFL